MTAPHVIYFGIRTQKSAAEVGGWSKVAQLGLKDALTYDTTTQKYHNYTKSQVTNLIENLQTADLIVGFNQLHFDYKILSSYTDAALDALPNFDILSKIEGTLNFRVSRDNLAQNTLGASEYSEKRTTLGKRIDTTKKLFAHGCKEGYLFYHNKRLGTKEVCDTSSWADIARSLTKKKQLVDWTKAPSEPESLQPIPPPRIPSEFPREKPISEPITTPPTKLRSELPPSSQTSRQVDSASRLTDKEYRRAKYLTPEYLTITEGLGKNSIGKRIPEEALRIYSEATSQHHRCPASYTYKKVADRLDPSISFPEFNIAIAGLWHAQNRHKNNDQNRNTHYFHYIDRSGTLAFERVSDYIDIRNIREELPRGI